MDMQSLQEAGHGATYDYWAGSPHLKHRRLYERLVSLLHDEITATGSKGLPPTVLEVGAGDGGCTEAALAFGCSVTASEMSRPSLTRLTARYGLNPNFSAIFDPDGSLDALDDQTFSLVLCASVLHHIPDYVGFLQNAVLKRVSPGGAIVSVQDPLWHADMSRTGHLLTKLGYFSWRITRGNYVQGARTQIRRLRGVYDQQNPSDMVEYHVVRSGVNQDDIVTAIGPHFDSVSLIPYWSTQSSLWQHAGEALGTVNTFALVARGLRH